MLTNEDLNALIDWLAECSKDPVRFVMEAFEWGEGELEEYNGPDVWQLDILSKIRDGLLDINTAIRIAVASGHGIGKSALVAWIVLWAISTMEDTRGVVTANTDTQLRTKTWAELQKWHRLCISKYIFNLTATAIYSIDPGHEKTWRIDIVPWSESNTEAFAGLHNKGQRILIVFDEASAIHDKIWEVTEGALTDKNTEVIWCTFGNPTRNTGKFRECFSKMRHRWINRQIDSRTAAMTNKELITEWIDDHGEDSDFVKVRVRGQFPNASDRQFIPENIVTAARGKYYHDHQYKFAPIIITCDPSWTGGDELIIAMRQGLVFTVLKTIRNNNNDLHIAGYIAEYEDKYKADGVIIDQGYGTGIYSAGVEMNRSWILVNFGSASNRPDCALKREEMWYLMREWLRDGGSIPDDQVLADDLTAPEYEVTLRGKIKLESKRDMKARGLPSPNRADALALSFAVPVVKKQVYSKSADGFEFANTNYDPLSR